MLALSLASWVRAPPGPPLVSTYGGEWHHGRLLISISVGTRLCKRLRPLRVHPPYLFTHNTRYLPHCHMSSISNTTSTTSNFWAIFDAALKDYTKKTGRDLCDLDHRLASKLDSCDNPDSILNVFREQAREFGEFKNGDTKLLKWLKPIVKTLHTISTNKVLGYSASSVNLATFIIYHHSCH
jgi:hypothetical protein